MSEFEISQWPKTVDDAVDELLSQLTWDTKEYIRDTAEAHLLSRFHHGLGTSVRNRYGLWRGNSDLLQSCGSPTMHPDDASEIIIKALWERLQYLPSLDTEIISSNEAWFSSRCSWSGVMGRSR
jgi:hypothetical protein